MTEFANEAQRYAEGPPRQVPCWMMHRRSPMP